MIVGKCQGFWAMIMGKLTEWARSRKIVALSPVIDYMYRPAEYESVNVYDWIRRYHKRPIPKRKRNTKSIHSMPIPQSNVDDSDDFENDYKVDEGLSSRELHSDEPHPQQQLDAYDIDETSALQSDDEMDGDEGKESGPWKRILIWLQSLMRYLEESHEGTGH